MTIGTGTYDFRMTAGQVVNAALKKTGAFEVGETIPPQDFSDVMQAFNLICKDLALDGAPLWCLQDVAFPGVAGQAEYNLSTIMGMPLPPRILDAYIRSFGNQGPQSTGNDVGLLIVSRYDYNTLGQKFSPGVPNQVWYSPQLTGGILTLYNVPSDSFQEIHVVAQRQIADVNLSTDLPDFPQEAGRMLVWLLTDEISLDYRMPPDERKEVNAKATAFRDRLFDSPFINESASVFFTPSVKS